MAGLPALLLAGPASAAEETLLEGQRSHKVGIFKDKAGPDIDADEVQYAGRLTSGGSPVAGRTLTLERKLVPTKKWVAVGSAASDGNGVAVFTTPVKGNASYRVSFAGDDAYAASRTTPMVLKAMRDFNARLVEKGNKVFLAGNINPGWGNKTVSWQKKTCKKCTWRTVAKKRSAKNGSWRFQGSYPGKVGQEWYFRAAIGKSQTFVASKSAVLVTKRTLRPVLRAEVR
jgi:hypothetical protein